MEAPKPVVRPFPNLDGVRVITHNGGCGGTRADARSLCKVLSAYADHPNVAGITVFSLGCQNAQIGMFKDALAKQNPDFDKPVLIYEQQQWDSEEKMMKAVLADTLTHLKDANKVKRQPVPLSHLKIGVKCGGSDGFSGISANPAMSGYLGATLFTLLFGVLVTQVGYSPMFVVLAVFDVLAAIVVWMLVRESGPRPPMKSHRCL